MKSKSIFIASVILFILMFAYFMAAVSFAGMFSAYYAFAFTAAFIMNLAVNHSSRGYVVPICALGIFFSIVFWLAISSFNAVTI